MLFHASMKRMTFCPLYIIFIIKEEKKLLENIRLSFQGIWSHKMRSFLTMLGIIIGIAAIISIVSTIKGTNEEIKNSLVGSGSNTVNVLLYTQGYTFISLLLQTYRLASHRYLTRQRRKSWIWIQSKM